MKIVVVGTRGFPGIQGGVEVHCEKLYPRLAKLGCEIIVFTRKHYCEQKPAISKRDRFAPSGFAMPEGVNLIPLDCPKNKSFEATIHTFKGILQARKINPDILHVHSIGPSLFIPLARLLGLKVIMTNHGPEYKRKKWGFWGRLALKIGEGLGSRWANEIICISEPITGYIKKKYKRDVNTVPNGVDIPGILESTEALKKHSLVKGRYILTVGRFVPEKGFHDLIDAFNRAKSGDWKLVIVGRADHEDEYSRGLKEKAESNSNIVLTGFLHGKPLQELYSHAGLFVLPSYYEGLPIVLLEAMSYGLLCLVSDIPANRCVSLPDKNYFPAGDIGQLSEKLRKFVEKPLSAEQKDRQIKMLRQKYDWDEIARKTLEIYRKMVFR